MAYTISIQQATVEQWMSNHFNEEKVKAELKSKGYDTETEMAFLKEYKKQRDAQQRSKGFICLAAGALLGFISCVLSIINPIPELYNWILFGLTSLAILIIFLGLYYIME